MSKSIVISQPRFLPALNYFQRMEICDCFVFLDTVQYSPSDWENRNKIKTPLGAQWVTVPVKNSGHGMRIFDTEIENKHNWRSKILKTLRQNYSKAPFYTYCMPYLEECFSQDWYKLVDLNMHLIDFACRTLDISCEFVFSSELNVDGSGEALLINLCKNLGADKYISGSLGRNYITKRNWDDEGIELCYHDFEPYEYPQIYGEFLPWLCFVDLFMNCGPKSKDYFFKNLGEITPA
ncbi:WbqC family protein [Desulfovibrio subterraneus]|uniref:WbqC-like protein family protein n=1 Tax=Desulfovibrio subterraneus TaxID=2718620 RepID=A0A7J0BN36_9BACT|nr:WbqC family protein [Desulfovibrio subterraneus]GFM35157.1 hypothetical protein DSM101010T_35220 [Desulfovibrio subterraneus]